jgi:hypothetical protein
MAVENAGGPASGQAHGNAAGDPAGNGSGLSVVPSRPASLAGLDMAGLGAQREFEPRIARMEAEMDAARKGGFLGLLRLRYEAWLEERMMVPAIRKMQARQAVLEQQCKTAEAEIRLKATVQSGEVGAQRHRIEWNEVNRQRLAGELHSLGLITYSAGTPAPSPLPAGPPPVSPHVTDEQVEAVALRGFLQGVETEKDWLTYRGELSRHLSPYTVEEVGQRLRELWRINRQAVG